MVVLDTHALVWWVNDSGELSRTAKRAIEAALKSDDGLVVSSISAWEIALLVRRGRLLLTMDVATWLATVAQVPGIRFVPVDNEIAIRATDLPEPLHKDPADRMIVALARHLSAPLVTGDAKIRNYRHVKTIW